MCRFQHNLYLIIFYDNCQLWVRNQLLKTMKIAISFQKECQERLRGFWVEREIIFGQSEEKCWASLGYNILILFAAWVPQRPHGVTTQKINDSRFGIVLVHSMHLSFVNKGPKYFAIYLNPKFGCSSVNNSYMDGETELWRHVCMHKSHIGLCIREWYVNEKLHLSITLANTTNIECIFQNVIG